VLSEAMPVATLAASREASDRVAVFAALRHAGGRRGEAARLLGLTRQGLQKLMTRLDLAGGDLRGQT
jgi:transcriptional regulator with GAF, ATPase, and Fis domain